MNVKFFDEAQSPSCSVAPTAQKACRRYPLKIRAGRGKQRPYRRPHHGESF